MHKERLKLKLLFIVFALVFFLVFIFSLVDKSLGTKDGSFFFLAIFMLYLAYIA